MLGWNRVRYDTSVKAVPNEPTTRHVSKLRAKVVFLVYSLGSCTTVDLSIRIAKTAFQINFSYLLRSVVHIVHTFSPLAMAILYRVHIEYADIRLGIGLALDRDTAYIKHT